MVQFNFSERTIKAKVVYYGPAQSGKTTNLEQIHRLTDPTATNRLISLNTAQDRTLFFDLLPFSLGTVSGYNFEVQVFTVPGQVQYNATRRVVLAGADAVVFVADARKVLIKENLAALENMKVNLLANRLVPEKIPLVLQYNKQDLSDLATSSELNKALNLWGRGTFPAVATSGTGVMETFMAIVQEMLTSIAIKNNLKEKGLDPAAVPSVVAASFAGVLERAAAARTAPAAEPPSRVVISQPADSAPAPPPSSPDSGLVSEELLHRAIRANVDLAEALGSLVREMNAGLAEILSHAELLLIYKEDARDKRAAAVQTIQKEASRLRHIVQELGTAATPAQPQTGQAGLDPAAAFEAPSRASAAPARPSAAPSPPPAAPSPPAPAAPAAAPDASSFEGMVRQALSSVQGVFDERGLAVNVRIPAQTGLPRCPAQGLQEALAGILEGVAKASPPSSPVALRCERKPVLLRSREGEVRQDFLMLGVAHQGAVPAEEQQQILEGGGSGSLGAAARRVREMGGFVRFAPLPGGAFETRVFLPS